MKHTEYRNMAVTEMSDSMLIFDRRQIEISIQCGVGWDYQRKLEQREREIDGELARRRENIEAAEQRAEAARLAATPLEKLWALIDAGVNRQIDPMATDEHYRDAITFARDLVGADKSRTIWWDETVTLAQALLDMEDQLAQARGLLVSITRAAEKWREIARGAK